MDFRQITHRAANADQRQLRVFDTGQAAQYFLNIAAHRFECFGTDFVLRAEFFRQRERTERQAHRFL